MNRVAIPMILVVDLDADQSFSDALNIAEGFAQITQEAFPDAEMKLDVADRVKISRINGERIVTLHPENMPYDPWLERVEANEAIMFEETDDSEDDGDDEPEQIVKRKPRQEKVVDDDMIQI